MSNWHGNCSCIEGHWRKLADLVLLAHERRQVCCDELSEMLELADAARLCGLVEWEEAEAIGLLNEQAVDPDDVSFFVKWICGLRQNAGGRGECCVGGNSGNGS